MITTTESNVQLDWWLAETTPPRPELEPICRTCGFHHPIYTGGCPRWPAREKK